MSELDITVVESGGEDNGANFIAGLIRFGEIDATSVEDMVDKILEKLRSAGDDCCIKSLTLVGHGSPGNISVGDGQGHEPGKHIGVSNVDEWKDQIERLKGKFCDDAEIFLRGCNTAAEEEGACLLALLAGCLGAKVSAVTGTCRPLWTEGETVEADSEEKPAVKPIDGEKKKKKKKGFFSFAEETRPEDADGKLLNGRRTTSRLVFRAFGTYRALDLCDVGAVAWMPAIPSEQLPVVWKPELLSDGIVQNILNGIETDIEPTSFEGLGFDVLGYLHFYPLGNRNSAIAGLPPSPIVSNYEWIIPAGDWCRAYQLTDGAAEMLRSLAPNLNLPL